MNVPRAPQPEQQEPRTRLLREAAAMTDQIDEDFNGEFDVLAGVLVAGVKSETSEGFRVRLIDLGPLEALGALELAKDAVKRMIETGAEQ